MIGIAAACFNIAVSCGIPLAAFVYLLVKKRYFLKYFAFGAAGFLVSQVILKIPLLTFIQGTPAYQDLALLYPFAVIFVVSLSAGLFEEPARYLFLRMARKKDVDVRIALAYGIGHGGLEAVLFVGANNIALIVVQPEVLAAQGILVALAGIERISALIVHVSLSVVVYLSVVTAKKRYLAAAITIHTLFNFSIAFSMIGVSNELLEAILFVEALGILFGVKRIAGRVLKT